MSFSRYTPFIWEHAKLLVSFLSRWSADVYLVTGVTGLVGAAVADAFRARDEVIGVSRRSVMAAGYTVLQCDIRDAIPDLPDAVGATVVHCAAEIRSASWDDHWRGNVQATKNVLDWAVRHKARRVIFISSGAVYGSSGKLACETDEVGPSGNYAQSKHLAEQLCRSYAELFSLPTVIHRLYFPYDVGQQTGLFGFLYNAVQTGGTVRVNVQGSPAMSITALQDVVSAIEVSADSRFPVGTYNLCGDEILSVEEIYQHFVIALRKHAVVVNNDTFVPGIIASNAKLKRAGWQPQMTFAAYVEKLAAAAGAQEIR
ncbi:NAD-dependent epimerase/dehydratase family protein [Pseudomonas sp. TE50-2]|uniref:NAD-dependent epimerase/dehydratase family protein n=1 Tax=Pseudomonas sp. TE50-2 TaxID=3142707 RepID=UPI003465CE0E